jgi:hypothetical protein
MVASQSPRATGRLKREVEPGGRRAAKASAWTWLLRPGCCSRVGHLFRAGQGRKAAITDSPSSPCGLTVRAELVRDWPGVLSNRSSLIGRSGSSAFRPSVAAVSMSLAGSLFSPELASAIPKWDPKTRWNNLSRGPRQTNGGSRPVHGLTSSIVPRGTISTARLRYGLCRNGSCFRPLEIRPIDPHAVHDDCHAPRQSDNCAIHSPSVGDFHAPGLEPRPFGGAGQ